MGKSAGLAEGRTVAHGVLAPGVHCDGLRDGIALQGAAGTSVNRPARIVRHEDSLEMAEGENSKFSATNRWGGDITWKLRGETLRISDVIALGGPGNGVALVPYCLDEYERVLRLKPLQTWLVKRMIRHAWSADAVVTFSLHKLVQQADIERNTVRKHLRRLIELGYVEQLNKTGSGNSEMGQYCLKGMYVALAACIMRDPRSRWAEKYGALTFDEMPNDIGYCRHSDERVEFALDLAALEVLARRAGRSLGIWLPGDRPEWRLTTERKMLQLTPDSTGAT